jgi:nucleotide-binding universal stress UspA family protein
MPRDPIVAGTDGSATASVAVDKAGELAEALGAPVHLVCVPGAVDAHEWPARITAQEVVAKAGENLRGRGITVETHLPKDQGDAALALVATADHVNAQMIVVGNKGMTGIRRLLGSFPNTVSHRAGCNVLIVPTQSSSLPAFGGGSVVVETDASSGAAGAVAEAIRLSKALGGELHIVSAQEAVLEAVAADAAEEGVSATTHVVDRGRADALHDVADSHQAAIIVVDNEAAHAGKLSHQGNFSVLLVSAAAGREGDAIASAEGNPAAG